MSNKNRPRSTVTRRNEPNMELMTKAYLWLYYNGRLKEGISDEKGK